jgi:hypothetical protein
MGVKLGLSQEGEEHRFRVFESTVLGKIPGPKMGEVAGSCRKCHNEEVNDFTLHQILFR